MRTAVGVGAGGGWLGGALRRARRELVFAARGETLDVLCTEGLRLKGEQTMSGALT